MKIRNLTDNIKKKVKAVIYCNKIGEGEEEFNRNLTEEKS